LRFDSARAEQKPARPIGVRAASLPPTNMMSAAPARIVMSPRPIAWLPEAQADETQKFGPCSPRWIATWPVQALIIIMGTRKGDTRRTPFSWSVSTCCSVVSRPPMPEPMIAPTRVRSTASRSIPASLRASSAETIANCVTRSRWRTSFLSK
jgi:hypothetical protein